jgi:hypothetical protein
MIPAYTGCSQLSMLFRTNPLVWAPSELSTWHERFAQARTIIKKIFRWHPAPGGSYQGFLKMLDQWQPKLRGAVVPHLREQMQEVHRAPWETGG